MRRLRPILFLFLLTLAVRLHADTVSNAVKGRIVKVLPLFMDTNNAVALSPSLFDRDAYQYYLMGHSNEIAGVRFDVCWKAKHAHDMNLKLRVEARGVGAGGMPRQMVLERTVTPKIFHHWTSLTLAGTDYKKFGVLAAWRATLWNGNQLLSEQQSFLWSPP